MLNEEAPVIGLVDPLSTRYGHTLSATFVAGNKIALHAFKPVTSNTRDQPTEYANKDPVFIQLLQQDFIFSDTVLRGLIAESNSTFVALQALKHRGSKHDYLKYSRTYRSIIRACLEKLEEASANAELRVNEEVKTKYRNNITIFYAIESIWHLCEILQLNATSTNTVVPQLLDWVRFHFPNPERDATDLMLQGRDAAESDEYWPTLKALVEQGQVEVVRAILQLHPAAQSAAYKLADDILKSMPIYQDGYALQKFHSQWEYWLNESERKLATNLLANEPNLELLLLLVTGQTEAWYTQLSDSAVWYELLPGYLFYTNPTCKYFELATAANSWLNQWAVERRGANSTLKRLDYVLLHIMENDMLNVITEIQQMPDNQWFATHFIDLLYNSGQLKLICDEENVDFVNLRDYLLYEFGSCLMTRQAMWQLGIDYLDQCKHGRAAIELLLARIPIRNERQAFKILAAVCQKGFDQVEKEICKVLSKRSFNDERYGNALEWALRSKDALYVTTIADFILKNYTQTGNILCPDLIANIGAKMFISPRLVFLVKYYDFSEFYHKGDFLPAAELLVNLLDSRITPDYFWPSLIVDTIPLLESKDPKILTKETVAILHHLESEMLPMIERKKRELKKKPNSSVFVLKDYRVENVEEILSLLRLACARNLSRSLVIEHTEF